MITFKCNPKDIKTRELLAAEGNLGAMIGLMARFVVDAEGNPVDVTKAQDMLLDLDIEEIQAVQLDFLALITPQTRIGKR